MFSQTMADLDDLLIKTSRTFALSIPLLPEPTANEVRVAYLLFRIADTFEDSTLWPREARIRALHDFHALLEDPQDDRAQSLAAAWVEPPPVDHEGYVELLRETPGVLAVFRTLSPEARRWIAHHTGRTADGMARYVERTDADGWLRLANLEELKGYCYVVAGIVGEMLTELFLLDRPQLAETAEYLRQRSAQFGEALQLVNILKDRASDADEGRSYLPRSVPREAVFTLAREDLHGASDYTEALRRHGAPRGVVEFCALPVLLAWGTLARVEAQGPGAKLTRPEVYAITEAMHRALDADEAVIPTAVRESPIPEVPAEWG